MQISRKQIAEPKSGRKRNTKIWAADIVPYNYIYKYVYILAWPDLFTVDKRLGFALKVVNTPRGL